MSINGLLNVSKLGLFANQSALQAVSNNISNVNTPGYSRQTIALTAEPGARGSALAQAGSGVRIADVTRSVDTLVENRLQLGTSELGRLEARNRYLTLVEDVFNELDGDGLSTRLEEFFSEANNLADNPTNAAGRASVVGNGRQLAQYVNNMADSLGSIAMPIDEEINEMLANINNKLANLRDVDHSILLREQSPNEALDLKDTRQQLVLELSQLIDVQVLENGDGTLNIQTASGELLLDHDFSATLSRGALDTATGFNSITINGKSGDISGSLTSGELAGLLEVRDQIINGTDGVSTQLESIVDELRFQINAAAAQSVGPSLYTSQTGAFDLGTQLDTAVDSLATNLTNPPPPDMSRIVDGTITLAYGAGPDGLTAETVTITAGMTINEIVTALNDSTAVDASISNNRVVITSTDGYGVVSDTSNAMAALGIGVIFTGQDAADMGVSDTLTGDYRQLPVARLQSDGNGGYTFDDANNDGALAIADVRDMSVTLFGESRTISGHYASVVGQIGAEQQRNEESLSSQQAAQDFMQNVRDSISGISLEEELTDLMRFQRAFQASSKMVSTADSLFDSLLNMV
ncbi:flagellar hook-associated protein FlgK [Magnetofaba australis]|uniref:Flagellar hook-associated protein 1 n=1 Tax=Magnetofaba australis IT-1 TaxID=1434232 RepID=A0A1Y2K9S3_9PROT|nr:flagellar hook-associated protein FlgK [Magnetofaba australis]OSM06101.1 putative flagellar hook-associated protein FlgK [Magnetofaba australis IT-1]